MLLRLQEAEKAYEAEPPVQAAPDTAAAVAEEEETKQEQEQEQEQEEEKGEEKAKKPVLRIDAEAEVNEGLVATVEMAEEGGEEGVVAAAVVIMETGDLREQQEELVSIISVSGTRTVVLTALENLLDRFDSFETVEGGVDCDGEDPTHSS